MPFHLSRQLRQPYGFVSLVGSGGNFMTDGNGTAVFTSRLLRDNRKCLGLSGEALTTVLREQLGVRRALVFDDPTNSSLEHVDLWAKFVSASTVLVAEAAPHDARAAALDAAAARLARDYHVLRVRVGPAGGAQHARCRRPLAPYLNSLILNERVYVPTLPKARAPGCAALAPDAQADAAALAVYAAALPHKEIIGVPSGPPAPWRAADALHCRAAAIPAAAPATLAMRRSRGGACATLAMNEALRAAVDGGCSREDRARGIAAECSRLRGDSSP